jgi:hypothetical protein
MKLINEKWTDLNGGQHKLYTVRSGFFFPVNTRRNFCPIPNGDQMFTSREQVWDWLRDTDVEEVA